MSTLRCVEHLIPRPNRPFPLNHYPSVKDLYFCAIRKFSTTALKIENINIGPDVYSRPLKDSYQDELYRSCYVLLGNLYMTLEWTGSAANAGPDAEWLGRFSGEVGRVGY